MKWQKKIALLSDSFEKSLLNLNRVSLSSDELATVMEQVTASSIEINNVMNQMAEDSEIIKKLAEDVLGDALEMSNYAKNIAKIDGEIFNINKSLMKNVNDSFVKINNDELIQYLKEAINAHKNWLSMFSEMVARRTIIPLQDDGHKCKFGHFYHTIEIEHPEIKTNWYAIDDIHNELHKQVHVVTEHILNKNYEEANRIEQYTKSFSEQIVNLMEKVIKQITQLTKQDDLALS